MPPALLSEIVDLVLPRVCAGCPATGRTLCRGCATELTAGLVRFGGPRRVWPTPAPVGFPRCWAVAAYRGPVAAMVGAFKDDDRRDVGELLGALLAESVAACVGPDPPRAYWLVPAPGSRAAARRRGRRPLEEMTRVAAGRLASPRLAGERPGAVVAVEPLLVQARRVADQAGLDAVGRQANLAGAVAVRARRPGALAGRPVVLVDDVVTSGATLTDCARALHEAGLVVLGAATVCATQRHPRSQPVLRLGAGSSAADSLPSHLSPSQPVG